MLEKKEIDLREIKLLGGIGSVSMLALPFVGLVLLLVALKKLANATGNEKIFRDFFVATIISLVFLFTLYIGWMAFFLAFAHVPPKFLEDLVFSLPFLFVWVLAWIGGIFFAIYASRSLEALAKITGEKMFNTAGLLIFIGAILTIAFVGLIILFIGWIYLIVAFFSLPDKLELKVA
ncbi:DUF996 domain-containing protein [bacterium]|nr:DUF996 domain-containing protein [bacterium]